MDAYERITRNTAEVVTDAEIETLAADPDGKRAYVGYEPSGVLHIGHMLTANKLIDLQAAGFEVSFASIRSTAERMRDQFIAYGLDESNTQFVLGSDFQLDEDYTLDLHALELETTLARAERAMSEIKSGDSVHVSQAVYPLMQALDIPYLGVDLAVGGVEQRKVHMLARDVLPSIDREPPTSLHTPLIADLTTGEGKMSSSAGVTISMEDDRDAITETNGRTPSSRCSSTTCSRGSRPSSSSDPQSTAATSSTRRTSPWRRTSSPASSTRPTRRVRSPSTSIDSSLPGATSSSSDTRSHSGVESAVAAEQPSRGHVGSRHRLPVAVSKTGSPQTHSSTATPAGIESVVSHAGYRSQPRNTRPGAD
jgi:tyrosyl-tRNA synthetase